MIDVKVAKEGVEDDEPPSSGWLQKVVKETLETAEIRENCEVSVLVTNDQKIQELNRQYRDKDKPTDVLSFAFEEDDSVKLPAELPRMLGDIVISMPTIARQAQAHEVNVAKECAWAVCHGGLHLLGHDHQSDDEESAMRALEEKVLKSLGEEFLTW